MESPVAAIDIGTNSVRLLILDQAGAELVREMEITRLGQGVDQCKALHPEAIARTLRVLNHYATELAKFGVTRVRTTATSAARDASNRAEFFDAVERTIGHRPELLSGADEAMLSFQGATATLAAQRAPYMVFDIGGGSTEFAFGSETPERFLSIDMGGVRLTERFLHDDPPSATQVEDTRIHVRRLLDEVEQHMAGANPRTWLGLAGTVTTFAAHAAGISQYDPCVTHGFVLTADAIHDFSRQLLTSTCQRREDLILEPKRAGVIIGGAVILEEIVNRFALSEVVTSESDILDGLAGSLLD